MRAQTRPTRPLAFVVACLGLAPGVMGCNGRLAVHDESVAADAGGDELIPERPVDACGCTSSIDLMALGCDNPGDVAFGPGSRPLVAPDGAAAAFVSCRRVASDTGLARCDTLRWTSAGDSARHRGVAAVGMSDDGATLLVDAGSGLQLLRGVDPPIPLPTDFVVGSALLARDGALVAALSTEGGLVSLVRWRETGGTEVLGVLGGGAAENGRVTGMTPDGSTIIGYTSSGDVDVPFRWTAQDGVLDLGSLPGSVSGARPLAVSDDGATIAGFTTSSLLKVDIFRQVAGAAVSAVAPAAAGSEPDLNNLGLSADGMVLAGATSLDGSIYRLSQAEGALLLETALPASLADMTADGAVIVGNAGGEGFRWSSRSGEPDPDNPLALDPGRLVKFSALLAASGPDLSGWELRAPVAVSDDGQVVFGRALCGSVPTLYRWVIPR